MVSTANPRPQERDVDIFGRSHVGKVRQENQDQYFAASLHKTMRIRGTSVARCRLRDVNEPVMALLMVADGVGGGPGGRKASETAVEAVWSYLAGAVDVYWTLGPGMEHLLLRRLEEAVERCHAVVCSEAERNADLRGMATTLTMAAVVWPRLFVVQVGDSRCYRLQGGQLQRLTTDQTMAQALLAQGLPPERVDTSRLGHVLASAIGSDMAPATTTFDLEWDDRLLLCTDGLTNHLTDGEIRDVLVGASSARDACGTLVDRALHGGANDNVTVVVGRLR
jgi:serine/threonine protein phosphatase PrpC